MRIFVVGATGAIGRRLVQLLVERGHHVVGTTRSPQKIEELRALGVEPAQVDLLDSGAATAAVRRARPEVIVHQATALSGLASRPRFWDQSFALTNRLRVEGTDHLIAAARVAGARRLVAQSFAGWPYAHVSGPIKSEEDPLDPDPVHALRAPLAAIRHLEAAVATADDLEGVILRYGAFYGPGTSLGVGGVHFEQIRRRRLLIIEPGMGVWSFVHIDDAATATAAAIELGARGIYNIVDDDPAPVSEWLPALAAAIGAKPPLRVPRWLGRLVAGEAAVVLMTEARGASNAKAKRVLGWQPSYASWRNGFRQLLTASESGPDTLPRMRRGATLRSSHPHLKRGGTPMEISRYGIVQRPNSLPHISGAVVHGGTVYLRGVTPDPDGDITSQTRQVLERIDTLLAQAGTSKSKLLTAQVWLSDMRLFEAHNAAWNEWVDRENPPVRACVRADLVGPGLLVEIMVTAAR